MMPQEEITKSLIMTLQSIIGLDKEHIRMSVETFRECSDGIYRWSATDREWEVAMDVLHIVQYIANYSLKELFGEHGERAMSHKSYG